MFKKRQFFPTKGVSNVELFYDLIFVYCISVMTSLCHHVHGDFLDLGTWGVFIFSYLVVLQVWFFTTLLINRYGDRSASDTICLFVNMFLLYFLANGIQNDWKNSIFTFNSAWALILLNLIIHWASKLLLYDNLDDDDRKIIHWNIGALAVQLVVVIIAAFLPAEPSSIVSIIALLIGCAAFRQPNVYHAKPARFSHLAERCSLLVILAFGETVVAISTFMTTDVPFIYPVLIFALVAGLFLIYIYEHDNMLDHHKKTNGIAFMSITSWIIVIVGNLTVALEFMPMDEISYLPKSTMLIVCIVAYLLTSFLLVRFNKPEFHYSFAYIVARVATCILVILVAIVTNFDPAINLIFDVLAVYFVLFHECLLYRGRLGIIEFGRSLGMSDETIREEVQLFETAEGRRTVRQAVREARDAQQQESTEKSSDDER